MVHTCETSKPPFSIEELILMALIMVLSATCAEIVSWIMRQFHYFWELGLETASTVSVVTSTDHGASRQWSGHGVL